MTENSITSAGLGDPPDPKVDSTPAVHGEPALPSASQPITGEIVQPGREQRRFTADKFDAGFALVAYLLGFCFVRWLLFSWQGYGVTAFTLMFVTIVSYYLKQRSVRAPKSSYFWLAILVITGASYSVWQGLGLQPLREFFLFCSAVYWVASATGNLLLGQTSNWLPLDALFAVVVTPWRNFFSQYQALASVRPQRSGSKQQLLSIGLGVVLALLVSLYVLPLLFAADSGGFAKLTIGISRYFQGWEPNMTIVVIQLVLTIPTAAYIFALVAGSAHRRGARITVAEAQQTVASARILPAATIITTLGLVSLLYFVFIASQAPYFFSAFMGRRPEGWQVYSEYARNGFFELCSIAIVNLLLLAGASLVGQSNRRTNLILRIENGLLALLTLLLISTAFSKMVLYIGAYGLSVRRLLPCVFMALLAIVCIGVVILQRRHFSIARLALGAGALMLCAVWVVDLDTVVGRYNARRYLQGTLSTFDVQILHDTGAAGILTAISVYEQTDDPLLRKTIDDYLMMEQHVALRSSGRISDSLQARRAREKLAEHRTGKSE